MPIVFEKIPQETAQSFHCERVHGPDFGTPWHFHPELELTLVRRSQGHRMVGDRIAPLTPGDLVLVGSNLPHVWHQDKTRDVSPQAVDALVIQFAPDFLGAEFWQRPELRGVGDLLTRAARGLHVKGATRGAVVRLMEHVFATTGVERLIGLLQILACLAASGELAAVASVRFRPVLDRADQERMERVCRYIDTRLAEPVMRDACAAEAHLSAGAFSRFFRTRTGMTLPAYVSELRIGRACHLLEHTDERITDIVFLCGFGHVANFNLCFRRQLGLTPREYRQRVRLLGGSLDLPGDLNRERLAGRRVAG